MSFPIKTWLAVLETEVGINVWDPQFLKQKKPEKATNKRRESVSSPLRHLTSASQLTGPCRGWVATLFLPTQHPDRQQLPGVDITGGGVQWHSGVLCLLGPILSINSYATLKVTYEIWRRTQPESQGLHLPRGLLPERWPMVMGWETMGRRRLESQSASECL